MQYNIKSAATANDNIKIVCIDFDKTLTLNSTIKTNTDDLFIPSFQYEFNDEASMATNLNHPKEFMCALEQLKNLYPDCKIFIISNNPNKSLIERYCNCIGCTEYIEEIFSGNGEDLPKATVILDLAKKYSIEKSSIAFVDDRKIHFEDISISEVKKILALPDGSHWSALQHGIYMPTMSHGNVPVLKLSTNSALLQRRMEGSTAMKTNNNNLPQQEKNTSFFGCCFFCFNRSSQQFKPVP